MTTDLLILLGGMLGALAFRAARPASTWSWGTLGEVGAAACSMLMLVAIGPDELRTVMGLNPVRTLAFSFLISFLAGAGLITLSRTLLFRWLPRGQSGDLTPPQGRRMEERR